MFEISLKEKVAIVTGGAAGIGRAIARHLAKSDARIMLADIDADGAKKAADEINILNSNGNASAMAADVSRNNDAEKMVNATLEEYGRIDILVNNAGGAGRDDMRAAFIESKEAAWDFIVGANLKSVRNCCRAVVPHMAEQKDGKIVNIASIAGMMGSAHAMADYSAAKGGVISLTKALAKELGKYGINVNAVSPGPIGTDHFFTLPKEVVERIKNTTYLGKIGKPEDIANLVTFLASDKANFITGQNYAVCGGRSLGG